MEHDDLARFQFEEHGRVVLNVLLDVRFGHHVASARQEPEFVRAGHDLDAAVRLRSRVDGRPHSREVVAVDAGQPPALAAVLVIRQDGALPWRLVHEHAPIRGHAVADDLSRDAAEHRVLRVPQVHGVAVPALDLAVLVGRPREFAARPELVFLAAEVQLEPHAFVLHAALRDILGAVAKGREFLVGRHLTQVGVAVLAVVLELLSG